MIGILLETEGGEKQIHTDDAKCLLLQSVVGIQHADVNDQLTFFVAGERLELDSHPTMAFISFAVI